MTESTLSEPSMDEILASIRRIISDDMSAPDSARHDTVADLSHDTDVLLLTQKAPLEPWALSVEPLSEGALAPVPPPTDKISFSIDSADLAPAPFPRAADSFERLYFVVENTPPQSPPLAVSASGPTLEDMTRDLLRPMIKSWLDENLDAIVRARVDEEIERIVRGRVR